MSVILQCATFSRLRANSPAARDPYFRIRKTKKKCADFSPPWHAVVSTKAPNHRLNAKTFAPWQRPNDTHNPAETPGSNYEIGTLGLIGKLWKIWFGENSDQLPDDPIPKVRAKNTISAEVPNPAATLSFSPSR